MKPSSAGCRSTSLLLRDLHAAIRGADLDRRAAASEVGRERLADRALHGDRKIDANATVGRARFEVRIVLRLNRTGGHPCGRLQIGPPPLPVVAVEIDVDPAVGRVSLDVT